MKIVANKKKKENIFIANKNYNLNLKMGRFHLLTRFDVTKLNQKPIFVDMKCVA